MANYYEILGVAENASMDEIKRAYRLAVKKYHPDLHANATSEEKKEFEEKTKEINEAYSVLSDANRRAAYNASYKYKDDTSDRGSYGSYGGGYGRGSGNSGSHGQGTRYGGFGKGYGYDGWKDYGFSEKDFEDIFGKYGFPGGGQKRGGNAGNQRHNGGYGGQDGFSQKEWDEFWQKWQGSGNQDWGRYSNPYSNGRDPFGNRYSRNTGGTSLLAAILNAMFGRRAVSSTFIIIFLFILFFGRYILYFLIIYFLIKSLVWAIRTVAG